MLISHRYRFIYTKTAKTASTSVESFFEQFCMPEGAWTQSHARSEYESPTGIIGYRGSDLPKGTKWWNHMSASEIKKIVGSDVWDSYFKFCVVRNPFEKCISAFCHFGKDYQVDRRSALNGLRDEEISMEQLRFIGFLQKMAPADRDKYIINGEFCLDNFIRYETLGEDIRRICRHIDVPFDLKNLPMFKKGIRDENATIESLYTKKSRDIVERLFDFELQYFGYHFPNPVT